jgi:hypothetical protein
VRRFQTAFQLADLDLSWGSICAAQTPALGDVKTVYFWPMRHSLDQYLAEQLSADGPFPVVVDPKLADAIITERIDAPFLKAMDELLAERDKQASKTEGAASEPATAGGSVEEGLGTVRPANRPMGRPQGTVFLVHASSRRVLWSTFLNQKDVMPKNLHQQARDIVGRLKKEMQPKN